MSDQVRAYFESIGWVFATIAHVFRRQPWSFATSTALMGVSRIMQFLSRILPLKVILLAASEHVPHYMPFVAPEHRMAWILGLAVFSVLAYILSQVLDAVSDAICERTGTQFMREAADLSAIPNQEAQAQSIFALLASVVADLSAWAIGMVLFAYMSALTFSAYLFAVVASFLIGTAIVTNRTVPAMEGAHTFATESTPAYLRINGTIIFFLVFVAILYPFVTGWGVNLLVALVSIILLRRTIDHLSGAVSGFVNLIRRRHIADALMYRNRQLVERQNAMQQSVSEMFAPTRRDKLAEDMLAMRSPHQRVAAIRWVDPVVPGVSAFAVTTTEGSNYQLQIYPRNVSHLARNEAALFAILDRGLLPAPSIVAEMNYGRFFCRLLAAGDGVPASAGRWAQSRNEILVKILSIQPSSRLIDIYLSTHLLPHQKLTPEFVRRIEFALRNDAERDAFQAFLEHLPRVRDRLQGIPLAISIADFHPRSTMENEPGLPLLMYWGRWSLEPLGGGLMFPLDATSAMQVLDEIRALRSDVSAGLTSRDLQLAQLVQQLVTQIERAHYGQALDALVEIEGALREERAAAE